MSGFHMSNLSIQVLAIKLMICHPRPMGGVRDQYRSASQLLGFDFVKTHNMVTNF